MSCCWKNRKNETASQAILREIYEETKIEVQQLFSADYLEQFYEPELNVIELIPVFVGFCMLDQKVLLNHEHTDFKWCSLAEANELAIFSNQRQLYHFIWENFVERLPEKLLKIKI